MSGNDVVVTWPVYDVDGPATGVLLKHAGLGIRLHPRTSNRTPAELAEIIGDAVGVIASTDTFDASVFAACPNLKVIARTGVGVDAIDVDAATEAGVVVATTPGANEEAVADHALAMILALQRRLAENDAAIREGRWDRAGALTPSDLYGATVGLVGSGVIGRAVIRRLRGFGSTICVYDPYLDEAPEGTELVDLPTLLARSDVISVHAPLTDSTRGLLDAQAFAAMKPGSYVVNVSRGGIIDEDALAQAIRTGHLAGAGIDTFAREPIGDSLLRNLPTVIMSPHIAGLSHRSIEAMTEAATQAVLDVLAGRQPAHPKNPEALHP
ncbi:MAG TPA: phosphoglycerate dehydrogenase [Acidimicrobiia bacterium]